MVVNVEVIELLLVMVSDRHGDIIRIVSDYIVHKSHM